MKVAINRNVLKQLRKPAFIALATAGTIGLGYVGCQYFGRAAMFTTAGCLGGLGGTAQLVEVIKPETHKRRSKNV